MKSADQIIFVELQRGRCAREFRREDLDAVLPNYTTFLYRDQQVGLPRVLESNSFGVTSSFFAIQLGFGTYGMEADGTFTLLAKCEDSSD